MVSVHGSYYGGSSAGQQQQHPKKQRRKAVQRHDPDLLTRTSWTDARVALMQIQKGKASGNTAALWVRAKLQLELFKLGCSIQRNAGIFLFVGLLILASFAVCLKSAVIESRVEKLWVEEGGRLQKELEYVESTLGLGAGSTNELIIQTPADDAGTVLTSDALLTHLEVIKAASKVIVEKDDVTWQLKDLCYAPTIPMTEIQIIDQILDKLFPCAIITPLDCFWEGSKLLGPDHPVHIPLGGDEGSMLLSWTSLNPLNLLHQMSAFNFNFDSFEQFMKRAGINSGYQEKPCLNPYDPDCPPTAPNKEARQRPDIGAELTGGCYGFATRYMHWPEELVVGGTTKNKTGHITRAKGLQSSIQLMGEKDLYDYWSDTYKIHTLEWSRDTAEEILKEWQAKFSAEVAQLVQDQQLGQKFDINAFSSSHLSDILQEFSEVSVPKILLGYTFMLIYAGATLFRWSDVVRSQAGLGIGGVFLVTVTVAGGLGCCAIIGITFNASTTQIVPFLALGLGVDAMFLLTHAYAEMASAQIPFEERVGEVLRRAGVSVLLTAICNTAAFLAAAVIPIPALRAFAFQAALLIVFNALSMLLLFPALLGLDLRRVVAVKVDILCCYRGHVTTCLKKENDEVRKKTSSSDRTEYHDDQWPGEPCTQANNHSSQQRCCSDSENWTLTWCVTKWYSYWVTKAPVKVTTVVFCMALTSAGFWGLASMKDGLDLTEVVPRNTSAYNFLKAQDAYFGFYNMYAVTQGHFEYPQNQKVLYDYHNAFVRVPNIIKDDDGGLNEFWLSLFRNWLDRLQKAFDNDWAVGNIHEKGWHSNASDDGILAYKLLVQTGHVDYPVDETLISWNRLVDAHGIINPSAFYNYLSAWYSNDAMAYSHSQASLVPSPKEWHHDARDADLRIPKSMPIVYAQIPFYLNNLGETETMIEMIRQVRNLCAKFEQDRGLPNFPSGVPFTFWEQYVNLRMWMLIALGCVMAAVFLVLSMVLMSAWIAIIVVVVIATILVQLLGAMSLLGIKMSALPAVILILSVGLGVEFTVHICIGFVTSIGNKNRRIIMALQHMFAPVFHGAFSTFLGIVMLAFSHFDFVVRYFFLVFTALIILGIFNGLVFLPVLLVLVGPPGEVIPNDGANSITPPSPEIARSQSRRQQQQQQKTYQTNNSLKIGSLNPAKRHNSDLSLSTIAEESASYASSHASAYSDVTGQQPASQPITSSSLNGASVFVEPHVVVETTTYPSHSASSGSSSGSSTPNPQVTKVTATAKFKVEVHAPSVEVAAAPTRPVSSNSRRSRRREAQQKQQQQQQQQQQEGASVCGSLSDSLRSSLSNSVSSSLSSNDGDHGFSEK